MIAFSYHPETGLFLGTTEADESPLEPDVWMVPANATLLEPPAEEPGFNIVFVEGEWVLEAIPVPPVPVDKNITAVPDTLFGGPSIREALSGQ